METEGIIQQSNIVQKPETEADNTEDMELLKEAASCLKLSDIVELKKLPSPSKAVEIVTKGLMIVLGEEDLTWSHTKKVLQKRDLITSIWAIIAQCLTLDQLKKLQPLVTIVSYKYVLYANKAAASLWAWLKVLYYSANN